MTILVTCYSDPDLDGTACAMAYAEYLELLGQPAVAAVFGTPQREARFVLRRYDVPFPARADELIDDCEQVILVDASDTRGISDRIDHAKVVEVIDHRPLHEADAFPNALTQIEWVGAAATLIARKFRRYPLAIGPGSAALLYHAIASNTIAFQASVTTLEDRELADWLLDRFDRPPCVDQMFEDKSRIEGPLRQAFEPVFARFNLAGREIGIVQREAIGVREFLAERLDQIEYVLHQMRRERGLELIFLTCIDVGGGFNSFVAFDPAARELLSGALGIRFEGAVAERPGIMMRKEIVPLLSG